MTLIDSLLTLKFLNRTLIGIKLVASNGPALNQSCPKILIVKSFGGLVPIFVPPGEISVKGPVYELNMFYLSASPSANVIPGHSLLTLAQTAFRDLPLQLFLRPHCDRNAVAACSPSP